MDALYVELKDRLATLPRDAVVAPHDTDYEQRELLGLAPDGNFIAFGQDISQPA